MSASSTVVLTCSPACRPPRETPEERHAGLGGIELLGRARRRRSRRTPRRGRRRPARVTRREDRGGRRGSVPPDGRRSGSRRRRGPCGYAEVEVATARDDARRADHVPGGLNQGPVRGSGSGRRSSGGTYGACGAIRCTHRAPGRGNAPQPLERGVDDERVARRAGDRYCERRRRNKAIRRNEMKHGGEVGIE